MGVGEEDSAQINHDQHGVFGLEVVRENDLGCADVQLHGPPLAVLLQQQAIWTIQSLLDQHLFITMTTMNVTTYTTSTSDK